MSRSGRASAATDATTTEAGAAAAGTDLSVQEPFVGVHQSGILNPAPAQATLVALDSLAPDTRTLMQALQALSHRARELTTGGPVPLLEVDAPPADSGTLGPDNAPDALTVTIGFGSSLFDKRYGLASKRPRELTPMPTFPVDELDPAQTHGDVCCRSAPSTATRSCIRCASCCARSAGRFQQRWTIDGFQSASRGPTPQEQPAQPVRVPRRHREPADHRRDADERARVGRSGEPALGRRRHLPGRADHPHARRVLGSGRTARTGEHDRPSATPGRRWAARTSSKIHATTSIPRASGSHSTRTSGWPTPARSDRRPANPAPRLQLPPRLRQGRAARPGTRVRRLQPEPQPPVRRRSRTDSTTSR